MRTIALTIALLLAPAPLPVRAEEEPPPKPRKQRLAVGTDAPEITAHEWLNTDGGTSPILPDLSGKVVMLEFWGTWCGPCVRSMPKVQALHERYKALGLIVAAITREGSSEVRGFLKDKGYTMPVGCDPDQVCVGKFSIAGWPTTYLVGANGTILYSGSPYGVEAAIEKALGLESSPTTLLTTYLDAGVASDKDARRQAAERLLAKAPAAFDLRAWAEGALGEPPEETAKAPKLGGEKELTALAKAWANRGEEKQNAALTQLAVGGPSDFDLRAWIQERFAKAYPLKSKEVEALLDEKRYGTLLDAMIDRNASGGVIKKAAKHDGFKSWCSKGFQERRVLARKAIMGLTYWMRDGPPPKGFDSEAFSRDISVSGVSMDKDRKRVIGILIGGESVMKPNAETYAGRQLQRWFLMDAIGRGKSEKIKSLPGKARKEYDKVVAQLKRMYG